MPINHLESKQVLIMRKFPKGCRTGKYVSQGSHASVGALFSNAIIDDEYLKIPLSDEFVRSWVLGRFKKITLSVDSEQELLDLYAQAKDAGLLCSLIRDAGLTEFAGVPTFTAVGIGPGNPDEIDKITGKLSLF